MGAGGGAGCRRSRRRLGRGLVPGGGQALELVEVAEEVAVQGRGQLRAIDALGAQYSADLVDGRDDLATQDASALAAGCRPEGLAAVTEEASDLLPSDPGLASRSWKQERILDGSGAGVGGDGGDGGSDRLSSEAESNPQRFGDVCRDRKFDVFGDAIAFGR